MNEGFIGILVVGGLIWLAMRSKKRRSRNYSSTNYYNSPYHQGADGDRDGDGIPDSMDPEPDSANDSGGSDD